ncbi:MAG TPA: proline--tRNA ligase [Tepidisphaeraceae bacterium]|jgi:prolyl-tRNA synthetase|nr:proline--tRNA ligase [Tepidisphaeraceae bacterium]
MRWTQTLIPTQKENPADAQIVSHQLMIRAGLIRQLTAGVYDFLPLGLRSLQKAAAIVREEMNGIGCAEVLLPALQPLELWQQSGRDAAYGPNLMRLKDRHGRQIVLGPTHEEVVTELVKASVTSYRQLPLSLYQIQTKFRDEYRPRFGLLRVREFLMKDAYSFHASLESLNETYDKMYAAYSRIFMRCGIPFVVVEAESGPIGGSVSHEFMAACAAGEDTILSSDKGNYVANVEKAETGTRPGTFGGEPTGALEKVHTPNLPSIEDVGKFMKVKPKNMLKSMLYVMTKLGDDPDPSKAKEPRYLLAIVRGDHDVNEAKLAAHAADFVGEPVRVALAPEARAREDEWALGFVGPHAIAKRTDAFMLVDPDAAQGGFWAAGANEIDHHVKHFNWFRETGDILANPARVRIADIRNAIAGDPAPKNDGGILSASKGIEIGHVFKLGAKYSVAFDATVLDESGKQIPMIMGCYGIGIGRILIAAVESLHDDKGIIWPKAIAPYSVVITPIKYDGAVKIEADRLYQELTGAGIDVLLDDRDARPGVKFADADLIGFPLRITIGDRGLAEGKVELKLRNESQPRMLDLATVANTVKELLR